MQYMINEYLKQYPKSESFYQTYILPQLVEHKINPEECRIVHEKLHIGIKGVDILIFTRNSSVQILPHSAKRKLKCSYIKEHYQTFDISTFLKSKHNKEYYVSVSYKQLQGYENELHNLVSQTIDCIKNVIMRRHFKTSQAY